MDSESEKQLVQLERRGAGLKNAKLSHSLALVKISSPHFQLSISNVIVNKMLSIATLLNPDTIECESIFDSYREHIQNEYGRQNKTYRVKKNQNKRKHIPISNTSFSICNVATKQGRTESELRYTA